MHLQLSHAAAQAVAAHFNLPVSTILGIVTDEIDLIKKWLPTILGTQAGVAPGGLAQMHAEFAARDQARGLPSGTILRILGALLPILGQLLGSLGAGGAPAPVAP